MRIATDVGNLLLARDRERRYNRYQFGYDLDRNRRRNVSSDAVSLGTFVTGGTVSAFNNSWTAQFSFTLPVNVMLTFANLSVDDRAMLIGAKGIGMASTGCSAGSMVLTNGGNERSVLFA